ncbi:S41 family peptidase [Chitinimonas lacunae]|uniref:Tricorn protease homolog n=1 Tax=Chitinimonas lacunae TaxID=1963018 RepID=A0ABV8MLZ5_9NEIS
MQVSKLTWALGLALGTLMPWAAEQPGYFRFPSIAGDQVVFTAEGDLWTVPVSGGRANRLTTHPAQETHAALSPDGRWVAFSANYEGTLEAYVMPSSGGQPKRLSFEGARAQVVGWSSQGEVLFSTRAPAGQADQRVVVAVEPHRMKRRVLPLLDANEASFDPDGKTVFFTRYGLHLTNDNARRYRGGAAAQLWRFELDGKAEAVRYHPDFDGSSKRPMWWQDRLYFISDRDGIDNLWSMRRDGSDLKQHTRHQDFAVRNAALSQGRIVYQWGADLRRYDIADDQDRPIAISLTSDFEQMRERWIKQPLDYLTEVDFSAKGESVLLTARGRLVLASNGPQRRVEIALPPGSRARAGVLSPDGKWVYAICDASGETEVWRFPADGSPGGRQLTHDGVSQRLSLNPSPDGKWLAHNDKRGRLWLLDLATGKNEQIDDATVGGDTEYSAVVWSPDSRAIAFTRVDSDSQRDQVLLYSLDQRRLVPLSSDRYQSSSPAFTPDGRWLYFISERHFQASQRGPWGDRNMGPYFDRRGKLYAIALQPGHRFPFQPKDELATDDADDKSDSKKNGANGNKEDNKTANNGAENKDKNKKTPPIAWEGLSERLYEVPLASGNYQGLLTDGKRLYFLEQEGGYDSKTALKTLAIDANSPQPELFSNEVRSAALSADGKKLFFAKSGKQNGWGDMYIVDAAAKLPTDFAKSQLRVSDWALAIQPPQEWRQIFGDAWRMQRDYLFDPAMRGVDWKAVRQRYQPLLSRLTDRAELDDLLTQMVSELGTLHSQVGGADLRRGNDHVGAASLGARLERVADGYKVVHIYRSDPELPTERSPLARTGVAIREGDVIVAVNGRPTHDVRDIGDLLFNQAGQQVLLDARRGNETIRSVVTPVDLNQTANLSYSDWEQSRRERVQQRSQGKIGYLHLRAMGRDDIAAFARDFYANFQRDGLIIDVRSNNGGNIDSWVIEKLLRRSWAFWSPPYGKPYGNMQQTFRGHLVVLIDGMTYSDGETFAAGIKALKLGPLVGQRTAGAGVWLSDRNRLADRGIMRAAETPQFDAEGTWMIEGVGVKPDIEVDNPPYASFQGEDRQLDAAIELLQKKLKEQPVTPFKAKPIPPLVR